MRDSYFTSNGLRLHYTEYGDPTKPPFVCLHGIAMHAHAWDLFASRLGDQYRVLALTARGHGDSDRADGYTLQAFADDTSLFLSEIAGAPAILCGHSMGAVIALAVALRHPEQVSKLLIVEGGPRNRPDGQQRLFAAFASLPPFFETLDDAVPAARPGLGEISDDALRPYVDHTLKRGEDGKLYAKFDPAVAQILAEAATSDDANETKFWAACERIQCPTTIVIGARSDIFDSAKAQRMAHTIPNATLVTVDSAHVVPLENPDGLFQALQPVIEDSPRPTISA